MRYILFLSALIFLTACSMSSNQGAGTIRIIKVQEETKHKVYNSKIKEVNY